MSENILSVGVDIGTSTTCVVFSDILIDNSSAAMRLPRAEIIEKKVRYRSPVHFTPLLSDTELNVEEIAGIIGADSLGYLSLDGVKHLAAESKCGFCTACFDGDYPVPPPRLPKKNKFEQKLKRKEEEAHGE